MTTKAAIKHLCYKISYCKEVDGMWVDGVNVDALEIAVRAMAEERKKGEWIEKWNGHFKTDVPRCSLCSNASPFKYNYCPTCGADMGRKEDAETD